MLKLSWKGILANKVRLALTATAIVLGVAFVAGSYVFTDSLKAAFDVLFEQEGQQNDLVVRAESDFEFTFELGTVPEDLLPAIEAVEGVETAVPLIQAYAQPISKEGDPIGGNGPPNLGFSWVEGVDLVSAINLRSGRGPAGPGEVAIDAFTADANGFAVGDPIDFVLATGVESFEVVGIVSFGDADNLLGATIGMFDLETAQRVFDFEGVYSQISVMVAEDGDVAAVQAAIQGIVPDGVEVITGDVEIEEGQEQVDTAVGFFNTTLLVFALIAVFVGGFIIQNTYRVIVSQRTKELAMLRAVGATGRQVTRMVLLEALFVGLIASVIGVGVGIALAVLLKAIFGAAGFGFPQGPLTVAARTVAVSIGVGVVITVASAILPARKASGVAPIAALREVESTYFKSLRTRLFVGLGVLGLGIALLFVGLFTEVSNALLITGIGAGVVFLGVAALSPLVARAFGRTAGAPLPVLLGLVGRLAQENAVRKPRRTAATASALTIGVALVSVIAILAASFKASITEAVGEEVTADFQVETSQFGDPTSTGVSVQVVRELRDLPEVEVASSFRIGAFRLAATGEEDFLIGVDEYLDEVVRLEIQAGDFGDLDRDGAAVFVDYAEENGIEVGDMLLFEFPGGTSAEVEVVAVYGAELFQTNVMISKDRFAEISTVRLDRMVIINVVDGIDPEEARPALEAVVDRYPNLVLSNAEEYIDKVGSQVDAILNIVTALLLLAIVIALLGIANTMALSIIERKREIGLLRAVGMSRRQVRRTVRWEAVLIGVFGALIGLVVGVGLGMAVVAAIGQGLRMALPWGNLLLYLVMAALGGVAASLWPAWRGSRMDILEAISYE